MALPLEGKIAVVTGSSRGIGKAIALKLAEDGADIAVCARTEQPMGDLPGSIGETAAAIEALGRRAIALKVDVMKDDDLRSMVAQVLGAFGKIDILVNNAAFVGARGEFVETDPEELDNSYRGNVRAPFFISQLVAPGMIEAGGGVIFNISAGSARHPINDAGRPLPNSMPLVYGVTKAALDRLATGLAGELFDKNVAVINIYPGFTVTEKLLLNPRPGMDFSRAERPETTAKAIAFLARDPMAFTGQLLTSRDIVDKYGL